MVECIWLTLVVSASCVAWCHSVVCGGAVFVRFVRCWGCGGVMVASKDCIVTALIRHSIVRGSTVRVV